MMRIFLLAASLLVGVDPPPSVAPVTTVHGGTVPKLTNHNNWVLTEHPAGTPAWQDIATIAPTPATPTLDQVFATGTTLSTNYTLTLPNSQAQSLRFVDGSGHLLLNLNTNVLGVEVGQNLTVDGVIIAGSGPVTLTSPAGQLLGSAMQAGAAASNLGAAGGDLTGTYPSPTLQSTLSGTHTWSNVQTFSAAPVMSGASISAGTVADTALATPPEATTGNITLWVTSGGNDNDPAFPTNGSTVRITSGDWTLHPFATPQGAFNALPKITRHAVNIYGGSQTTAGVVVSGFDIDATSGSITFTGTPIAPTLQGATSGTATSGTAPSNSRSTLTLTGANWATNECKGYMLNVTAGTGGSTAGPTGIGTLYMIESNTATVLTVQNGATFDNTTVFAIVTPGTIFQKAASTVLGNVAIGVWGAWQVPNFKMLSLGGNGATVGIALQDVGVAAPSAIRCTIAGLTQCMTVNGAISKVQPSIFYAKSLSSLPISMVRSAGIFLASSFVIDTCSAISFGPAVGRVQISIFEVDNSIGAGLLFQDVGSVQLSTTNVNTSTTDAIEIVNSVADSVSAIAGTGNGSFGFKLSGAGYAILSQPSTGVTVTGTSGDMAIGGTISSSNYGVAETYADLNALGTNGQYRYGAFTVSK